MGDSVRLRVRVRGAVQGVGFRPFVYRLAKEHGLAGWVVNDPSGVTIEVEGPSERLERFREGLRTRRPPMAAVQSLEFQQLEVAGQRDFEIRESEAGDEVSVLVLPDMGTCPDCLLEVGDEGQRRYGYPFTNCTNCGPRFSIIGKLPYDRANTTMRSFAMCPDCEREYRAPDDRRFHAQPIACPRCGPSLVLTDRNGKVIAQKDRALESAAAAIKAGKVVAFKGIGGYLLACHAENPNAVRTLRDRKGREEKPFALMYPNLESVRSDCQVTRAEEDLLVSPQRPIVLLRKKEGIDIAEEVAPSNPYLGVMLPCTPLHHLLAKALGFPVVATSGNRTDEPMAIDDLEARERLGGIAELFLAHDRPIARRVDDSILRVVDGRPVMLRRARGYAPLPTLFRNPRGRAVLALGGHLKSTVSFTKGANIFTSQHIGDLDTYEAVEGFREAVGSLEALYEFRPETIAVDMHPRYESTRYGEALAGSSGLELVRVQHHHAHVASCMCENGLDREVMGISWDGVGYGTDGQAWGGEFLVSDLEAFRRFAHLLPFPLPGGEVAIRKPSHSALGLLYASFGDEILTPRMARIPALASFGRGELEFLANAIRAGINCPMVSGVGRLFDAVSSILGLRNRCSFEGQAAMELEFEAMRSREDAPKAYDFELGQGRPMVVDWRPMVRAIVDDLLSGREKHRIALRFHRTLAEMMLHVSEAAGLEDVVLTGGVFQNALLTIMARPHFEAKGFKVHTHSLIPPNDGGISVGQAAIALARVMSG